MKKIRAFLFALASVLVIFVFGNTSAFAFSLPGIAPSGSPAFTNNVRLHLNPHGRLRMWAYNQTFSLDTGSDYDGIFERGDVSLVGKFEQLGMTGKMTLMTADLTAANLVDDPYLWGFNTTDIWCAPELQLNCTNRESVYVALSNAFSGEFGRNFISTGIAVTTIPVPAAIWLFGSALGLLGWARRRGISAIA
jgi:hypothetical protein